MNEYLWQGSLFLDKEQYNNENVHVIDSEHWTYMYNCTCQSINKSTLLL